MKRINIFYIFLISLTILRCNSSSKLKVNNNEHLVMSTIWTQISAEFTALQFQAFNIAKDRIMDYMAQFNLKGNEAIIVDIDETLLDTSPYQAKLILSDEIWPNGWDNYMSKGTSFPIHGSVSFLNYVDSLGIKIFYLSNRKEKYRQNLIKNLKKFNFPQLFENQIMLRTNEFSKDSRREIVSKSYNIILLIGDSLSDFDTIYEINNNDKRKKFVMQQKELFGRKFILLPNAIYGDWENIIYKNNWNIPLSKMDSLRKEAIRKHNLEQNK